jgi:hypothetical protein
MKYVAIIFVLTALVIASDIGRRQGLSEGIKRGWRDAEIAQESAHATMREIGVCRWAQSMGCKIDPRADESEEVTR